jgi:hypothetical protein
MRLTLKNREAVLANVNPRGESHGDQKKPAADLTLTVMLPNEELNQFSEHLRDLLYQKPSKGQQNAVALTDLRFPQLGILPWNDDVVGGALTFHKGIDAKSDLELTGCIINKFSVEPHEGGSVTLKFRVQFYPENEKQIGKLCMAAGQKVWISVASPTEKQQEKQRSLLEEDKKDKQEELQP